MSTGAGGVDVEGWGWIRASWWFTGLFVVTTLLAVAVEGFRVVAAIVDLVLFAMGVVVFLGAFFTAVSRSRTELIGVGGLYFLAGCAPRRVRLHLLGAFAVQVVVALVAASLAPFTAVAFGILVPVLGLGMAGWWGARYGQFPPRPTD
ncbi:MAG: hypothetical protein OES57_07575 [Acidimicrobiia bacterium]|nr:hypothetical protein [Acidimicrobiia bacterium]